MKASFNGLDVLLVRAVQVAAYACAGRYKTKNSVCSQDGGHFKTGPRGLQKAEVCTHVLVFPGNDETGSDEVKRIC